MWAGTCEKNVNLLVYAEGLAKLTLREGKYYRDEQA